MGDGISVGGDGFRNYSIGSGLASPAVQAVATADENWFFATDGGLTVLSAISGPSGQNPFDYVSNWRRIYMSSGLPSNNLTSVVTHPLECLGRHRRQGSGFGGSGRSGNMDSVQEIGRIGVAV